VRVKICGITRQQDAATAVAAGVWAVGLVFHKASPRNVNTVMARRIAEDLPPHVLAVAVFRHARKDEVERVVESTGITTVQLHGGEDFQLPHGVRRVRARTIAELGRYSPGDADLVIVDNAQPGIGTVVDWPAAACVARRARVILAGGLTPLNVASAITVVRPYAVDVSSGVETAPGVKDPELIRRFIETAHRAACA
jgi:phosphoribosylanthranilate isomerase